MLDIQQLETWLWDAACAIRGPVDAPKFKDYILPLVFLKRLSDVYDDEIARLTEEFGSRETAVLWRETEGWTEKDYVRDRDFVAGHKLTDGAEDIFVNGNSFIPGARGLEPLFKARIFAKLMA